MHEERQAKGITDAWAQYNFVSFMIFFSFSWIILFLNCFADKEANETKYPKSSVSANIFFFLLYCFNYTGFNNIT